MPVGLIVNPKSGKKSGYGLKLVQKLAGKPDVTVKVIERFGDVPAMMDDFARRKIDTLFISSGDGTIQGIQTDLAERGPFSELPRLCLLPHGTTNMTAADLGFTMKDISQQEQFIMSVANGHKPKDLRIRPTLKVVNPKHGGALHGMFLGTGAAWRGTSYCQTDIHKTGLKGNWANFATLSVALLKAAFLPRRPNDLSRIDRSYDMTIKAHDRTIASGGQTMYIASTLHKLILGTNPFWGGAEYPLRSTILPYPLPSIPRWSKTLLYGNEDRKVPPGCISFASPDVEITTDTPFVIDGEFFDPPENQPLRIETGPQFTYVCG